MLSSLVVTVTVTYARHAVLAKKSLEFAKGASEVEEASRSGLERVRERMRDGDSPGTEAEGTHDYAITPTGEEVIGEREILDHDKRELRVRASEAAPDQDPEHARIRARADVEPGSGPTKDKSRLDCSDGSTLLMAGLVQFISGNATYQDVDLAGLMVLENGATLTLEDVVLRGTIITRAGLCETNPPAVGSNRPQVQLFGDVRLLAGTQLPETAVLGPDLVLESDVSSRIDIDGFTVADEIDLNGRGRLNGMVVSGLSESISGDIRRPGFGRGQQDWPSDILAGGEAVVQIAFPVDSVPDSVKAAMASGDIN
ncbi:MAG: hypothetical protein ACYTCU_01605 [Planctomycetota bacterium]